MLVYLGIIFLLIFSSLFLNNSKFKILKKIIFIFLIFILAFNYQMGTDWILYQKFYESLPKNNIYNVLLNNQGIEKGYILYSFIIKNYLFLNYELFMGITLSVCIYILLNNIEKNADNIYIAIYIYILTFLFPSSIEPIVRQLIAIAIITLGLKYIEKRSFFKYLIIILLASSFHFSAIVMLPLYFFNKMHLNLKKIAILYLLISLVLLKLNYLLLIISKIVPSFIKFQRYFSNGRYGFSNNINFVRIIVTWIKSLICLSIIILGYRKSLKRKIYIENGAILSIFFMNFTNIFIIFYRVEGYFMLFFAIVTSSVLNIKILNGKGIKVLMLLSVFCLYGVLFLRVLLNTELNRYRYFPYKNYFIELLKGTVYKDSETKIKKYQNHIEYLIKKDNN